MNEIRINLSRRLVFAILEKIKSLEESLASGLSTMDPTNYSYFKSAQEKAIQNQRLLLKFVRANEQKQFNMIEDGSIVKLKIDGQEKWLFIYHLNETYQLNEISLDVDDGTLRMNGSLKGYRARDVVNLRGDEKKIFDVEVQILNVY